MKNFFNLISIDHALSFSKRFKNTEHEILRIEKACGRISACDIKATENLPGFSRSTMDGYAVRASSTFGASEGSPAWLTIAGNIKMGKKPAFEINEGEAASIPTGAMLPDGSDSVVMIEYTDKIDDETIEVYKSCAPGTNIIGYNEDFPINETIIKKGSCLNPEDIGTLAAFGIEKIEVFKKPKVGIISTGDEVIPINEKPCAGEIRDVNSYSIAAMVEKMGGVPQIYGIVKDNADKLSRTVSKALQKSDMVLVSGGSSVGTRDFTLEVFNGLPNSEILFHGISLSPGKPTLLCSSCNKPVFGLPGHVTSAMVVFKIVVLPFLEKLSGKRSSLNFKRKCTAILTRNISSTRGRTDFIRVSLKKIEGKIYAEPVRGKSGLLNTMVKSDGLVEIPLNTEGLEKNTIVSVRLM